MSKRDEICSMLEDEAVLLEPDKVFDRAILGVAQNDNGYRVAVYCYDSIIEGLVDAGGQPDRESAVEYADYNILGASMGPYTPIIVQRVYGENDDRHLLCLPAYATDEDRKCAHALLDIIITQDGNSVTVADEEEERLVQCSDKLKTLCELSACEIETLIVYDPTGNRLGYFLLIWSNGDDPIELIADYSVTDYCTDVYNRLGEALEGRE